MTSKTLHWCEECQLFDVALHHHFKPEPYPPDWVSPSEQHRRELDDLRQQLADQQREFHDKMLSVTKELATVTAERDDHKTLAENARLGRTIYREQRDDARRWASSCMAAVRFWRNEAHGYAAVNTAAHARNYWASMRGRVAND